MYTEYSGTSPGLKLCAFLSGVETLSSWERAAESIAPAYPSTAKLQLMWKDRWRFIQNKKEPLLPGPRVHSSCLYNTMTNKTTLHYLRYNTYIISNQRRHLEDSKKARGTSSEEEGRAGRKESSAV